MQGGMCRRGYSAVRPGSRSPLSRKTRPNHRSRRAVVPDDAPFRRGWLVSGGAACRAPSPVGSVQRGQAFSSPGPRRSVPDYAEWQHARLEGGEFVVALAYWRRHLTGAPTVLELPSDRARPAVQTYSGATISTRISPDVARGLAAAGESRGATTFMTLLASFAVLLARYTGQTDLIVGYRLPAERGRSSSR